MVTIKDFANDYEPQQMGNIADLELVKTDTEIMSEERENREGEKYKVSFIVVEGKEYRTPATVIEQLKSILEAKPELKMFKVMKTGQGMGTKYQVIPM
tara:strand:- start:540 stop:833 length:294 start_codon:yes stop_codon:yes gene_type:complete